MAAAPGELAEAAKAELARLTTDRPPAVVALGSAAASLALAAPLGGEAPRAAVLSDCPRRPGAGAVLLVTTGPGASCEPDVPPGTVHLAMPRPAFSVPQPGSQGAWFAPARADFGTRQLAAKAAADWLGARRMGEAVPAAPR